MYTWRVKRVGLNAAAIVLVSVSSLDHDDDGRRGGITKEIGHTRTMQAIIIPSLPLDEKLVFVYIYIYISCSCLIKSRLRVKINLKPSTTIIIV